MSLEPVPPGIARLDFRERGVGRFFNSAFIGCESTDAVREADNDDEKGMDWSAAVETVRSRYGELTGLSKEYHTVFYNTTAAVQRVFFRLSHVLQGNPATLMTTDLEYPGIMSLLDEHWHGRMVITQVGGYIWSGQVERVMPTLREAFLLTEPDVLYVSHVARATGYRIDGDFLDFARAVNPRVVIIVDGAQAAGNIALRSDFVKKSDFYLTSGHKWLCGREPLGIVTAVPKWEVPDPAQSYSRVHGSAGTGSDECLRSLAVALTDFLDRPKGGGRMEAIEARNIQLAKLFEEKLKHVPIRVVSKDWPDSVRSGIVAICGPGTDAICNGLPCSTDARKKGTYAYTRPSWEPWVREEGAPGPGERFLLSLGEKPGEVEVTTGSLRRDQWGPPLPSSSTPLRFCFHYYHDHRHVRELAKKISAILEH